MTKSLEDSFVDWEASTFGFGYGSGERHVLTAVKAFFEQVKADLVTAKTYDYENLEAALTPTVAWLIINALCRVDVIEYGSSPRYGWMTPQGERLMQFIGTHTLDDLVKLTCERGEDYIVCYPTACNCGPEGYEEGRKCDNPFWR